MAWPIFNFSFQNYFYPPSVKTENLTHVEIAQNLSLSDVKHYGLKAFECFKKSWEIPDFWKRANTSDACLTLLQTLLTQNPYDQVVKGECAEFQLILEKNLAYFNAQELNDKWSDDFGWWGLLGVNAYYFLNELDNSDLAKKYLNLSCKCYELMVNAGLDKDKTAFPIPHGCRNSTVNTPEKGVKNSVVNALLMLLSTKLYSFYSEKNSDEAEKFLVTAYQQWVWFSGWFELTQYNYLKHFNGDDQAALVGERPLAFVDGSSYKDTTNPDWAENWVWTGDQGLLINAFINLASFKNKLAELADKKHPEWQFKLDVFRSRIEDVTKKLIHGVHKGFVGKNGVFYEPPCSSSYFTHANDYFGGRGILIRHLEFAKVKELTGVDLKENVLKTVDALWETRDVNSDQFQSEFTKTQDHQDYAKQFGALWGGTDESVTWNIDSDPITKDAICQAVGMDFIAAALVVTY